MTGKRNPSSRTSGPSSAFRPGQATHPRVHLLTVPAKAQVSEIQRHPGPPCVGLTFFVGLLSAAWEEALVCWECTSPSDACSDCSKGLQKGRNASTFGTDMRTGYAVQRMQKSSHSIHWVQIILLPCTVQSADPWKNSHRCFYFLLSFFSALFTLQKRNWKHFFL